MKRLVTIVLALTLAGCNGKANAAATAAKAAAANAAAAKYIGGSITVPQKLGAADQYNVWLFGPFVNNSTPDVGVAAKLSAEAEALRGEYEAKTAAADKERETMLERARHEAEAIVAQAKADTAALLERRSRMAEDKIAAAERQAIDEVRARAAAAAAAAAGRLIAEELDASANKAMVDKAIADLGRRH